MTAPQRPRIETARERWGELLEILRCAPATDATKLASAIRRDLDELFPRRPSP